jgi:integrase
MAGTCSPRIRWTASNGRAASGPEKQFLYRDELVRFATAECRPNLALARDLLLATALRASELCSLNVGDLRQEGDTYAVRVVVKGRRPKTISIPAIVAERLLGDVAERRVGADAPLLVNAYGERWLRTTLSEAFARLARAAGITRVRAGAHQFRHALVVIARTDCGLDLVGQAALLNHSDTRTVAVYRHELHDEGAAARAAVWSRVEALKKNGGEATGKRGSADSVM